MRLGPMEIGLLVALALIIFGGSRIAGIGKALGTSIRDFKKEMSKTDTPTPIENTAEAAKTVEPEKDKV